MASAEEQTGMEQLQALESRIDQKMADSQARIFAALQATTVAQYK